MYWVSLFLVFLQTLVMKLLICTVQLISIVALSLLHFKKSYSLEKWSEPKYCHFMEFLGAVLVLPTCQSLPTTDSTYLSSQFLALISELASIGTFPVMTHSTKRSVINSTSIMVSAGWRQLLSPHSSRQQGFPWMMFVPLSNLDGRFCILSSRFNLSHKQHILLSVLKLS